MLLTIFISSNLVLNAFATSLNSARDEITSVTHLDPSTLELALRTGEKTAVQAVLSYRIRRGTDRLLEELFMTSKMLHARCKAANGADPAICANQLKAVAYEETKIRSIASLPITRANMSEHLRLATSVYTHHVLDELLVPRTQEMHRSCLLGNRIVFTQSCASQNDRSQEIRRFLSKLRELAK